MEWDEGALVGARNRPMATITVIDPDNEEGQPDANGQQEEGEILPDNKSVIVPTTSPSKCETVGVGEQEMTTSDLLPDYANQESASQSIAPRPVTPQLKPKKHTKKRLKPGTDSEAGVVPPGPKKVNKPDGFHKVGNYEI